MTVESDAPGWRNLGTAAIRVDATHARRHSRDTTARPRRDLLQTRSGLAAWRMDWSSRKQTGRSHERW